MDDASSEMGHKFLLGLKWVDKGKATRLPVRKARNEKSVMKKASRKTTSPFFFHAVCASIRDRLAIRRSFFRRCRGDRQQQSERCSLAWRARICESSSLSG